MNLSDVFRTALAITAQRRGLWLLGAIAVLFGLGAGSGAWLRLDLDSAQRLLATVMLQASPGLFAAGALGLLALGLVQSALGALLQGGLIALVERPLALGAALRVAAAHFRPLFLIRLLIGVSLLAPALVVLAAFIVLVAVVYAGSELPEGARAGLAALLCLLVPAFALAALAGLVLGWIEALALRSCLLAGTGVLASMRRGWQVLRARPLGVIALWAVNLVLGLAGSLALGAVTGPLTHPAVVAATRGEVAGGFVWPLFALGYALVLAAGGVLTALESAVWTVGYQALVGGTGVRMPAEEGP